MTLPKGYGSATRISPGCFTDAPGAGGRCAYSMSPAHDVTTVPSSENQVSTLMDGHVRIRAARSTDAIAMTLARREAILAKSWGHYEQATVEAWAVDGASERLVRYAQQIADPELIVLIAETGDDVLGFVIANPGNSEVCTIYVKPNDSGRVGRALLAKAEMLAFRLTNTLMVVASLNAVQFYVENGYVDEGVVHWESHDGSRSPCRKMRKRRLKTCVPDDLGARERSGRMNP